MSLPFFTVGHSDRTISEFIDLLRDSQIETVVDVRKLPGSARHPQFNEDRLAVSLAEAGIGYRREAGLTGRRPVSKSVPFEVNAWWENRSFHNYADHALPDEFREALAGLRQTGAGTVCTVMCSEAVWWRCHRRIIADHLLAHGEDVRHILGRGRVDPAALTTAADVASDGRVTYPAA